MRISDWSSDVCSSDLHSRRGVADIELTACDRKSPALERDGPGKTSDGVFGSGVGCGQRPRRISGDRPAIDNASSRRTLNLHLPERGTRAEEGAGQICVDDAAPVLARDLIESRASAEQPGTVEQNVDPLLRAGDPRECIEIG